MMASARALFSLPSPIKEGLSQAAGATVASGGATGFVPAGSELFNPAKAAEAREAFNFCPGNPYEQVFLIFGIELAADLDKHCKSI